MFKCRNNKRKMADCEMIKPPRKRRGNAAIKERERLQVFNDALEQLQSIMPLRLPSSKKLHKKQTVQLATKYITFLWECLDGKQDWENRHRFMWLVDKDDGEVIEAIDAASDNGAKLQTRDDVPSENFEPPFEPYMYNIQSHSQSVRTCAETTGYNFINEDEIPQATLWNETSSHTHLLTLRCDAEFLMGEKIFGFIQDYHELPEIAVDDVTDYLGQYSRLESFDSNCSSLSPQSDDSAYVTDLSNDKTP